METKRCVFLKFNNSSKISKPLVKILENGPKVLKINTTFLHCIDSLSRLPQVHTTGWLLAGFHHSRCMLTALFQNASKGRGAKLCAASPDSVLKPPNIIVKPMPLRLSSVGASGLYRITACIPRRIMRETHCSLRGRVKLSVKVSRTACCPRWRDTFVGQRPALCFCREFREAVELPETATLRPPGHCGRTPGCRTTRAV